MKSWYTTDKLIKRNKEWKLIMTRLTSLRNKSDVINILALTFLICQPHKVALTFDKITYKVSVIISYF